MSTEERAESHLAPEDLFGHLERTLSRRRRREVEKHLNECDDCLQYLGMVIRSERSASPAEEEALRDISGRPPAELADRLRGRIVATSPSSGSHPRRRVTWRSWVPAAAAITGLVLLFIGLQVQVLAPLRARKLAASALRALVELRHQTGRLPLRYIQDFERARVVRSGFDSGEPLEDELERRFRHAVEIAPNEKETHLALGLFLLDKGDLDGAEAELRRALELDPRSAGALNGLAVVDYERALRNPARAEELRQEGLSLLEKARRLAPEDPQVAFNFGMFYDELGRPQEAGLAWARYLEIDTSSEWAEVALENLEALGRR